VIRPRKIFHRIEGRLLRAGRQFARHLRQAAGREAAEHQRNAAGAVEESDQCIADIALVDVETIILRP